MLVLPSCSLVVDDKLAQLFSLSNDKPPTKNARVQSHCVYWLVHRRRSRKPYSVHRKCPFLRTVGPRPQTGPNTCHKTQHKAELVDQQEGEAVIRRQMWDYCSLHPFGKQRLTAVHNKQAEDTKTSQLKRLRDVQRE